MKLPQDVTLSTIKGGALEELFQIALARVLENIADPNMQGDAAREITIKLSFKPSADRASAPLDLICKPTKLAGPPPVKSTVYIGRRDEEVVAVEFDPTQIDIFDREAGADIVPLRVVNAPEEGASEE